MKINDYDDYLVRLNWIEEMMESADKKLKELRDKCTHDVWVIRPQDPWFKERYTCKRCGIEK